MGGANAGGGAGGPPHMGAEVVRELPSGSLMSFLNPLAYRSNAQPVASPVVAVAGHALGAADELWVFSLHADRKVRACSSSACASYMEHPSPAPPDV